jgi:histone H3/H4
MKELTKREVERIVKDEIKKFVNSELDDEISKLLKQISSKSRKTNAEMVKDGISKLAEFLWIRRNVWKDDIK